MRRHATIPRAIDSKKVRILEDAKIDKEFTAASSSIREHCLPLSRPKQKKKKIEHETSEILEE